MPQPSATHPLLALPNYLRIADIANTPENSSTITIALTSVRPSACCPLCQHPSRRVHSHYERTLQDLPCGEKSLVLRVTIRKFFCPNRRCQRKVFAERLPDLTQPYARRTCRQGQRLEYIGLALGGRAGSRLAQKLGLAISFKTLLRFVLASPTPVRPTPRVLGVDDWAFRKGHRYGTILYDLETHQPVELLPDRTAESLSAWLKVHPGVEIISRDRASAYSEGAREGAPDAVQVADRFHLLKNLGDALERLLDRKRSLLKQVAKDIPPPEVASAPKTPLQGSLAEAEAPDKTSLKPLTQAERQSQRRRLERFLRYEQAQELYQQGLNLCQIAAQMQLTRKTVRTFVRAQTFPERSVRTGDTRQLDAYTSYLPKRWQEGCHNARLLWEEVRERGYPGCYTAVKTYLHSFRKPCPSPGSVLPGSSTPATARKAVSVRAVVTALLRPETQRTPEETALLNCLDHLWEPFRQFHATAQEFLALVRSAKPKDQTEPLTQWIVAAESSGVMDMVSFAAGIKKDVAAVVAGLSLPWNNGPVEGSVNRLKMIKRQMYGRAGFALLRRRVLEPAREAAGHHRE
jgi:transposase